MNDLLKRLIARLKRVEREKVSWKQAVVTDNDPLTIKLNGSDTEVLVAGIDGLAYNINDVVTVFVKDTDMLALSSATSVPGGAVTYVAGDGLDLAAGVFSVDLKSGGGLKIDSTELAVDFGSGAGKVTQGNDSRLSDQRTPSDNSVTSAKIVDGAIMNADVNASAAIAESKLSLASDAAAGTASRRTLGTGSTQACAGNDSRLSDARTPTAHAASHKASQSDEIKLHELGLPTADVAMNTRKLTGLQQGSAAGHSVEYAQFIAGIIAAQMGFQLKSAVNAVSIEALPAHGRSGDVLTASANGSLAPSFGTLKFSWASGIYGTGNGQFSQPYDVALDSSGNIFVLDSGNNRVQKFNSSGAYQSQFSLGSPPSPGTAGGIAIDPSNNIWVTGQHSEGTVRLYKYNSSGTFQSSHDLVSGLGPIAYGVAIDSSGNVFATVGYTNGSLVLVYEVRKFNSSGVFQSSFGSAGSGNGQFSSPGAIAIDGSNNIFVADSGNHRVQKFNSSGTYQSQFGSVGGGNGEFRAPNGIEVDSGGNIWVSDYYNARVQMFNSSGTFQAQYGGPGSGNGQFVGPRGIAVTSGGDLIVADSINNRFQRFGAFTLSANDTVLVRHEGSGTHIENSIYTVTNPGSAGTKWVLTLRPDMGQGYAQNQSLVIALTENGQQNRVFTLNTPDPITVWTTPLTWSRFEPGGPPSPHALNHSPGGPDPIATGPATRLTGQNAEGTGTAFALADHDHALPDFGTFFGPNAPYTAPASAAMTANTVYFTAIAVPHRCTLTGISFNSSTNTGNCRVALYDSAGSRVANRSTNQALGFFENKVPFTAAYVASPGLYFAAVVFDGTPNIFAASVPRSGTVAGPGSGATATSITPPSAGATVPVMSTY